MKNAKFQKRFYRDWVKAKDLIFTHVIDKETDLQILTNKRLDKEYVKEKARSLRWDIENYIGRDPRFFTALKPLAVELSGPAIVQDMAEAAKLANVGPMASVAGAIAQFLGKDLLKQGFKDIVIENGGDIFLASRKARIVGIYSGPSKRWHGLGLKIKSKLTPLGICTSSGTVGHSLSFGLADSVVILAKTATLADAVATATGNRVQTKHDLQNALNFARSIKGVLGVVIIVKDNLISWGEVEFIR